MSRFWTEWSSALAIVQPETVIRWRRQGFRLYWRRKSRRKSGRPKTAAEIRKLIRQMSRQNPTWGAPRILSELRLLGHDVCESTVAKYMIRKPKPPSQTWRSFLKNHVGQIAATGFFTVPTITFRVLYVFLVLRHERRRVVHFNVTRNPTARWTAQQVIETFPDDESPRFLLRDRDAIYGGHFRDRVQRMEIEGVLIAPRAPRLRSGRPPRSTAARRGWVDGKTDLPFKALLLDTVLIKDRNLYCSCPFLPITYL